MFTAHALARADDLEAGRVWRVGQRLALMLGLAMALACAFGEPMLDALGQPPALARRGAEVLLWLGLGLLWDR